MNKTHREIFKDLFLTSNRVFYKTYKYFQEFSPWVCVSQTYTYIVFVILYIFPIHRKRQRVLKLQNTENLFSTIHLNIRRVSLYFFHIVFPTHLSIVSIWLLLYLRILYYGNNWALSPIRSLNERVGYHCCWFSNDRFFVTAGESFKKI